MNYGVALFVGMVFMLAGAWTWGWSAGLRSKYRKKPDDPYAARPDWD